MSANEQGGTSEWQPLDASDTTDAGWEDLAPTDFVDQTVADLPVPADLATKPAPPPDPNVSYDEGMSLAPKSWDGSSWFEEKPAVEAPTDPDEDYALVSDALAMTGNADRRVAIADMIAKTGLSSPYVEKRYDSIAASVAAAGSDIPKWIREHPEDMKWIRTRTAAGKEVQREEPLTNVAKAYRVAAELAATAGGRKLLEGFNENSFGVNFGLALAMPFVAPGVALSSLNDVLTDETGATAERFVKATEPRTLTYTEDARSEEGKALSGVTAPFVRGFMAFEDGRTRQKISRLSLDIMFTEIENDVRGKIADALGSDIIDRSGGTTDSLEAELAEKKREAGNRNYLSENSDFLSPYTVSGANFVNSMEPQIEGGLVGGTLAAGASLAGTAGFGAPAAPGAFAAGAFAGATVMTYADALGSSFDELRETRTEDGKLVDRYAVYGGAFLSAAVISGSEALSFGETKAMGDSLLKGFAGGDIKKFISMKMAKDPAFRAGLANFFGYIAKNGLVSEEGEEGVSAVGESLVEAGMRVSSRDNADLMSLYPPERLDVEKTIATAGANMGVAGEGGILLGAVGGTVNISMKAYKARAAKDAGSNRSAFTVGNAHAILATEAGKADPVGALAGLAAIHEKETGQKLDAFYIAPADVDTLFQKDEAKLEKSLGADVLAEVQEAKATGDMVRIPRDDYGKWYALEGSEKLIDMVVTRPGYDPKPVIAAREKANAEERTKMEELYAADNLPPPQTGEQAFRDVISKQLATAGGYTLADAKMMLVPMFAGIRTLANRMPNPAVAWERMTLRVNKEGLPVPAVELPALEKAKEKRLASAPAPVTPEAPAAPVEAIPGATPAVGAPGSVVAPAPAGEVAPAAPAAATPAPAKATVSVVPSKDGGVALEYKPADTRAADEAADKAERPASYILSRVADEQFALPAKKRAKVRGIEYGIDALTGLLNGRSFNAIPLKKGSRVAIITAHDIKPVNDHPTHGGHDEANKAMIAIAASLSGQTNVARTGADFSFHVKNEAEFEKALAKVQADIGQNIAITGITGPDFEATNTALTAKVDALRESGEWAPRGVASKGLDVPSLKFTAKKVEGVVPPKALVDQVKDLPAKDYFELVYLDAVRERDTKDADGKVIKKGELVKTGLLSAEGRAALPRKAYTLAYDMRGLRLANLNYGKDFGNEMLFMLGSSMSELGGSRLNATHQSGDEYVLEGDDPLELAAFAKAHAEWLDGITVPATRKGSSELEFLPVGFRHGIGTDYASADRDLNSSRIAEAGGVRPPTENSVPGSGGVGPGDRRWDSGRGGVPQDYRPEGEGTRGDVARLASESGDATLGFTEKDAKNLSITLTPKADLSTFLHETAHVFHWLLADLAARPDAPQSIKDDWAASLRYMGVEEGKTPTREQYEKFARAFERYLYEGKAPSEKMRSPFLRFSLWLRGVYRTLAGSEIDVQLSDEVVGVFDRLLASDEEITRQANEPRNVRMFASAEEAGMDPGEWAKYVAEADAATLDAARRTELAMLKEHARITEDWWKTEERRERELATSEYAKLPAVVANRKMRGLDEEGKRVPDSTVTPMNAKDVRRILGTDAIPKGIFAQPDTSMTPDVAAELYGFPTGKALLDALSLLDDEATWVKKTASARMNARYPDMLADRERLSNTVAKMMMGDEAKVPLAMRELNIVRAKAGMPPVRTENIERSARDIVAKKIIGDLSYRRLDGAANRSAVKAAKAAGAKKWEEAAKEKFRHVLDIYIAKEAKAVITKKRDKMLTLTKKMDSKAWKKRAGLVSPGIRDGAAGILHNIGSSAEPAVLDTLGKVIPEFKRIEAVVGEDLFTVDDVIKKSSGDWQTMSVKDFEVVYGALSQIAASVSSLHSVLMLGKTHDVEEFKALLLSESLKAKDTSWSVALTDEAKAAGEKAGDWFSSMDASSDKIAEMFLRLGGGDFKSHWYSIFLTASDAMAHENDLMVKFSKPLLDLIIEAPVDIDMMGPVDGEALFKEWGMKGNLQLKRPTRVFEIAMMMLHTGTVSSQLRLTQGYNITLDEVRRAADLHLSPKTIAWLQKILDVNESMWPESSALEERAEGIVPKKLEKTIFQTMHGALTGYMPAVYDSRVEKAGAKQEKDYLDPNFVSAGTSTGYMKSRVEGFTGALSLSPGTIMRHFNGVAHDISHREALRSIGRLISDQEVKAMVIGVLGEEHYNHLDIWLSDVGRGAHAREMKGTKVFDNLAKFGKTFIAVRALAGAIPTPLGDLSNPLRAVIGTDLKVSGLMEGLYAFATSPNKTYNEMLRLSGEQRARSGHVANELALAISSEMKSPLFKSRAVKFLLSFDSLFATLRASEVATRTPIWTGAHRQALKTMSKEDAVRFANLVVERLFPSAKAVHMPAIMRTKSAFGGALMFFGYFANEYAQVARMSRGIANARGFKATTIAAATLLGYAAAAGMFESMLSGRGPPPPSDGEDEPWELRWARWATMRTLLFPMQTNPIGLELVAGLEAAVEGKPSNPRGIAWVSVANDLAKALRKASAAEEPEAAAEAAISFLLPAQARREIALARSIEEGETKTGNPFRLAAGAAYGVRENQGQSFLSLMADGWDMAFPDNQEKN